MYSSSCYFPVNGSTGLISSDSIGNYQTCSWVITAPPHHNIKLTFVVFQLSIISRDETEIKVYDGGGKNDILVGTFTGTRPPFIVHTSGRFMLVMLRRKHTFSMCNFKGVYSSSTKKGEYS